MFKGSIVAIVTPMKDGRIDEKAMGDLVEFHLDAGTNGIVPCGTTGESATLSHEEHRRVIELCIEVVGGHVPVIAGTGSNSTEEAITLTRHAKSAGADGALLITPYYNKPMQEGLFRHFKTIAEAVDIPQILYNIPGRTGVNMLPETVARLTAFENIVGIKEGSGSMQQITEVIRLCGERLTVLSGDDGMTLPLIAIGGKGAISVTANIVPSDMAQMTSAAGRGDFTEARKIDTKLYPLHRVLFVETNPVPVKAALALMGKCGSEVRLPLSPLSEESVGKLKGALVDYGLV
ncbi:MAG: 4-hydroxy-tetrahydrodipicolinate synthase [Nitrospira sp.]|nr:4-hydroxy-tetrahydrodipicolinate synthase [Candidatus Manganitrophaceae bacterium]HIL33861.1 4-hydroxy-tetrahydrodipicolinate synthase [Candidatus Manganitrophaceae bacterium]